MGSAHVSLELIISQTVTPQFSYLNLECKRIKYLNFWIWIFYNLYLAIVASFEVIMTNSASNLWIGVVSDLMDANSILGHLWSVKVLIATPHKYLLHKCLYIILSVGPKSSEGDGSDRCSRFHQDYGEMSLRSFFSGSASQIASTKISVGCFWGSDWRWGFGCLRLTTARGFWWPEALCLAYRIF